MEGCCWDGGGAEEPTVEESTSPTAVRLGGAPESLVLPRSREQVVESVTLVGRETVGLTGKRGAAAVEAVAEVSPGIKKLTPSQLEVFDHSRQGLVWGADSLCNFAYSKCVPALQGSLQLP